MIDIRSLQFERDHIPVIPQICNNVGLYGAGYSGAISSRWPIVEQEYLKWFNYKEKLPGTTGPFGLGQNQYVNCDNVIVVNMISMSGVRSKYRPKPLLEVELMSCLHKLSEIKISYPIKFYFAEIGSGLAGGKWEDVKYYIELFLKPDKFTLVYI